MTVICSGICSSCESPSSKPSISDRIQEALISPTATPPTITIEAYSDIELEEVQKIMDEIMPYYKETVSIRIGLGAGEEIQDENGVTYLLVKSNKYKTINDIRNVAGSVFTENYLTKYYSELFDGEQPKYKEIDGKLCEAMSDGPGLILLPDIINVEEMTDTTIVVTMQTENDVEVKDVFVTLMKEDGNWRIEAIIE